jgi:biopolymer transport protein ExbB
MQGLRIYIESGGIAAWLILLTGVFLVMIGFERIMYLYFTVSFDSGNVVQKIRELVLARKYTQAIQVCNQQTENPELLIIKSGILAAENGREAMKSALTSAVLDVSQRCDRRLSFISLVASAATLLGLFGTITGLIRTFTAMANADAGEKARMLGAGISEAMYSTAGGLIIGIAAMVCHTICVSKADGIIARGRQAAMNLVAWIEQSERGGSNVR